jgi:hypothetical protein
MEMTTITLTPPVIDLALYAGDGAAFAITANDDSGPRDLTGDVAASIRAGAQEPELVEFLIDTTNATSGLLRLSLSGAQTASLIGAGAGFNGVWDCQWTAPGVEPLTLVRGKVSCTYDVTRP